MEYPVYTALAGGALLILQQILMMSTGIYRGKVKQGVGHGGDQTLERKMRRHGNLAENSAIFLIVLALLELSGASQLAFWFAIVFVAARIAHALAFMSIKGSHEPGFSPFLVLRFLGASTTGLGGIALGAILLQSLIAQL